MIICFSGTGNSRMVADIIQDIIGDELVRFPPGLMTHPERINLPVYDEKVIWVFPIFAWGVPKTVYNVIKKARITSKMPVTHHLICTCGDDIGYADLQWRDIMAQRNWRTGSAYSVQMPNTYTCLPGFDVDPDDVAKAKLAAMPDRVAAIVEKLVNDEAPVVDVVRGSFPWLKTKVFNPFFKRFLSSTKKFHVNDNCYGCGRCAKNCSHANISMVDGKPVWGDKCTLCLRCYHCCPQHAVQYGHATRNKGQYICPGYSLKI